LIPPVPAQQTAEECPGNRRSGRLQPPDESDCLSGFSRGLTLCSLNAHHGLRFPSYSAVCFVPINFDEINGQTEAEARMSGVLVGRLKPPSSTAAPAFFSGLSSDLLSVLA